MCKICAENTKNQVDNFVLKRLQTPRPRVSGKVNASSCQDSDGQVIALNSFHRTHFCALYDSSGKGIMRKIQIDSVKFSSHTADHAL